MNWFKYCLLSFFLCFFTAAAFNIVHAETLDIYVIDTCGGKAMIVITPQNESMIIDAGNPRQDQRDTKRIVETAKSLGISQFDYIIASHYDGDHSGNIAALDTVIPGKAFIDHGELFYQPESGPVKAYDSYINAIGDRKRIIVKPGDRLPVQGVDITVVTSGGKTITEPLAGAGQPNPYAVSTRPPTQNNHNTGSIGLYFKYGEFTMLDLADLLIPEEYDLTCPNNLVGTVDLFMVSHHGLKSSNAKFLIHAIAPAVSIMNNGATKGGATEVIKTLISSPGLQDFWQLHYSFGADESVNSPEKFIANLKKTNQCEAHFIKVSAKRNGSFTDTNTRNDFAKTYQP